MIGLVQVIKTNSFLKIGSTSLCLGERKRTQPLQKRLQDYKVQPLVTTNPSLECLPTVVVTQCSGQARILEAFTTPVG